MASRPQHHHQQEPQRQQVSLFAQGPLLRDSPLAVELEDLVPTLSDARRGATTAPLAYDAHDKEAGPRGKAKARTGT